MSLKININIIHIIENSEDTLDKINTKIKEEKEEEQKLYWKRRKIEVINELMNTLEILQEQQILIKKLINENI